MNNNSKIFIAFFSLLLFSNVVFSQLVSIRTTTEYSPFLGKREITGATAFGGLAHVDFGVSDKLTIGISFGYKLYSLSHPNQLELWGWDFWNLRYKNKIDSDLRADPNLTVDIGSVQKMDVIPLMINLRYKAEVDESFSISPKISVGILFFTRRLFAVETWSKKFNSIDYLFTYSYRNFAPDKKGSPLFASLGVDLSYMLFRDIELTGGTSFSYFIPTSNSFGYNEFPLRNELSFNLGINFIY